MPLLNSYIANISVKQLHRKHDLRVLRKKRLRHIIALAGLSVDRHRCEAAFLPIGIFNRDVQLPAAEVLLDLKALPVSRNGRSNLYTVEVRTPFLSASAHGTVLHAG